MHPAPTLTPESQKLLMSLMTRHQRQIFAYIYTLVPRRHDAEDLLQETSVVICEKFHEFRPGSDFVAWACQIAWWRIRYSRQKFARSKVVFARHEALNSCLQKLPMRDREFVLTRYEPEGGVEEAARRTGRSIEAAYKALTRIRKLLFDCVSHQLASPGSTP